MTAAYARRQYAGGSIVTTVPLSMGSGDSSFTLAASTNWPDGSVGPFTVVLDFGNSTQEKVQCSSRSGLVVTVAASGRGYDGTSAVSHSAGCSAQVVHCAIDDDEANQVVSAVLGQSGAAKGDIPVILSAAGPVTMTRLPVGANGSVLSAASATPAFSLAGTSGMLLQSAGSAVPTWLVPPGYLIATQQYAPASLSTYTVTTGSPAAVDTTNATLSFTVPASGNVDFLVQAACATGFNGSAAVLALALLNHSGGAQVGNTTLVLDAAVAAVTNEINLVSCKFHLTSLTPGALQLDLAASCTIVNGGFVYAHGYTGAANSSKIAPLVLQAFAA